MPQYNNFKYIYPQLAKKRISLSRLDNYDNGEYVIHPNYEGLPCVVFTNGFELMVYDQRGKIFKNISNSIDFRKLARSRNWYVYAGTYCSKPRMLDTAGGQIFQADRFIITDILVWDGEYLLGSTLVERMALLNQAFSFHATLIADCYMECFKYLYCTEITGIMRAKVYAGNFENLFHQINLAGYNGIVLRKKESELLDSMRSRNNRQDNIICPKRFNFFNF